MNVNQVGLSGASLPMSTSSQAASDVDGSSDASGTKASVPSSSSPAQGYTPSAELANLLHLAGQQPDIRPEKVQAALGKLQQGIYLTPSSAQQTATAMMNATE
jgi:hypothetical protein